MRALPPPANLERVHPDDMPTNPRRFKAWGDSACAEWPVDLMKRAYNAWMMESHWGWCAPGAIEMFRREYREWYLLTEDEKEDRMHLCQRESKSRQYHRLNAKRAANVRH